MMATETIDISPADAALQRFTPTDTAIAAMAAEFMPLVIRGIDDAEGAKAVHSARMVVKSHRIQVEKVRKELKADSIEYGRRVDAEAKRIFSKLEPIESYLSEQEEAHQAEKERIKNAARIKAEQEAAAKAEAEAARLKAEQEAESERLRVEREKLVEEQRKLDAERAAMQAEKDGLAAIEAERLRKIEMERVAQEAAERAKIETEARIAREAEEAKAKAAAAELARLQAEALRPDKEKLLAVANAVGAIVIPEVSINAREAAGKVRNILCDAYKAIREISNSLGG
jgi:chemotaxis protein histidine kinase CheA